MDWMIGRTTINSGNPVFFKHGVRSSRDFYRNWSTEINLTVIAWQPGNCQIGFELLRQISCNGYHRLL